MKNFLKLVAKALSLCVASMFLVGATWYVSTASLKDQLAATEAELQQARFDQAFQTQIELTARALYGEYRGGTAAKRRAEWTNIVSAIHNRQNDARWPNDLVEVLLYGCEINALCDGVPEDLSTDMAQEAWRFAQEFVMANWEERFIPVHHGHSWATPTAAEDHAYFDNLDMVVVGPGHLYYADVSTGPEASPRPKARPTPEDAILADLGFKF